MNIKILIILTSLLPFFSWADCKMGEVLVKEGVRVSLYDKGKSLENFKSHESDSYFKWVSKFRTSF
jgi:hypothetical protein